MARKPAPCFIPCLGRRNLTDSGVIDRAGPAAVAAEPTANGTAAAAPPQSDAIAALLDLDLDTAAPAEQVSTHAMGGAPRHAAAAASLSDLLGGDLLGDGGGATPPQRVGFLLCSKPPQSQQLLTVRTHAAAPRPGWGI